jgi:chaperonin cofactor prefoldin
LLNINPEGKLLKEIKDVMDEIDIITRINQQQQTVAETFVKHIKQSLLSKLRPKSPWDPVATSYENGNDTGSCPLQMEQREAANWTLARANHLLKDIQDRISELNTLQENAKNTSAAVSTILCRTE